MPIRGPQCHRAEARGGGTARRLRSINRAAVQRRSTADGTIPPRGWLSCYRLDILKPRFNHLSAMIWSFIATTRRALETWKGVPLLGFSRHIHGRVLATWPRAKQHRGEFVRTSRNSTDEKLAHSRGCCRRELFDLETFDTVHPRVLWTLFDKGAGQLHRLDRSLEGGFDPAVR